MTANIGSRAPSEAAKSLQDCLEKYAADGLKREIDFEEAVWRTLPAFIAPLGLLGALLAYSFWTLFPELPTRISIAGLVLVALGALSGSLTIWQLGYSVKSQRHRYPPPEPSVCDYAERQREHFEQHGPDGVDVDQAVLTSVRKFILTEVGESAAHNHELNVRKLTARTKAARWLFWTTVFTLAAGALAAVAKAL